MSLELCWNLVTSYVSRQRGGNPWNPTKFATGTYKFGACTCMKNNIVQAMYT